MTDHRSRPPGQSASRVRDHLANERTFLAWVRTALGLIGLGFVLARMGLFLRQLALAEGGLAAPRGLRAGREFLIVGVVVLILGTALSGWTAWHFERNRHAIETDSYTPTRQAALTLVALVVAGGLIIVGLVLWRVIVPD